MKNFFDRKFWLTGALTVLSLLLLYTGSVREQLEDAGIAIGHADSATREAFPNLTWALDERDRCIRNEGTYGREFLVVQQCDDAVLRLAKDRGVKSEFASALNVHKEYIAKHRDQK